MRSVGPFDLTDVEFLGFEFLGQEDGRQLREMKLHATWSGRELSVKLRKDIERDEVPTEPAPLFV
jgi:hypothetical protein